ncbi:condensation domain-containing protein [Mesobacillus foraminis]|uniref:Acyl-CoA synthetase (AMP-forming)/AMP-acid ligase II n=1 Tax=Mesobacillus foraminis TaxID=279826 RepID=A0A4R2AYG5_9BACI|nr:condensation domain-containing protein [Mesobacillus foraminis]TCN18916.1 acyl-CoA synthetase (AMP-forming)/AMP-acid ligase II [Mesobacillus foraminis]
MSNSKTIELLIEKLSNMNGIKDFKITFSNPVTSPHEDLPVAPSLNESWMEPITSTDYHEGPQAIFQNNLLNNRNVASTLPELLRKATGSRAGGFVFLSLNGEEETLSYSDFYSKSINILAGLQNNGVGNGQFAILQIENVRNLVCGLWACLLGGIIPIPLKAAGEYTKENFEAAKVYNTWRLFQKPVILSEQSLFPEIKRIGNSWEMEDLCILSVEDMLDHNHLHAVLHEPNEDEIALILLTSGTTGMPKAATYTHKNLLSNIIASLQMVRLEETDNILNWMPLHHAGGLSSMHFMGIYLGCRQVLTNIEAFLENPINWLDWIDEYKITYSWAPNFAFGHLKDRLEVIRKGSWDLSTIKYLLSAGQPVSKGTLNDLLSELGKHGFREEAFCPQYGMTEASGPITFGIGSSNWSFVSGSSFGEAVRQTEETHPFAVTFANLGKPLPGLAVRIVDSRNTVLREDVVGRIQLKGPTIIKNYYKNPEATAESFTEDGWLITGDLGFLSDGTLTITGREKDIIIINAKNYYNFEIENQIEELFGVKKGFVAVSAVSSPEQSNDDLAVFFSPIKQDSDLEKHIALDIKHYLGRYLGIQPKYIIPINECDFPITSTGKIQRGELVKCLIAGEFNDLIVEMHDYNYIGLAQDAPQDEKEGDDMICVYYTTDQLSSSARHYFELRQYLGDFERTLRLIPQSNDNDAEKLFSRKEKGVVVKLTKVFSEILHRKIVRTTDNFYHLGGDSLKVAQLLSRVRSQFGINITPREFSSNPTILFTAKMICEATGDNDGTLCFQSLIDSKERFAPLTPSQRSLWFLYQKDMDSPVYTSTFTLHFKGALNVECLKVSLEQVINRHESLHTRLRISDGEPQQYYQNDTLKINILNLSFHENIVRESKKQEIIQKEANTPFDLLRDPLIRLNILRMDSDYSILVVSIHHIITDGWSTNLFVKELLDTYEQFKSGGGFPKKNELQYVHYVNWLNNMVSDRKAGFQEKIDFWKKSLDGGVPSLSFPYDYSRPAILTHEGNFLDVQLDSLLSEKILQHCKKLDVTPYVYMLSLYSFLLHRYTGQGELVIGTVMANRTFREFETIMGYFANTLALRINLEDKNTLEELFLHVKQVVLEAQEYQDVPLEVVIGEMEVRQSRSTSPLFQTMFTYQNELIHHYQIKDLQIELTVENNHTSKFDFLLHVYPKEGSFLLRMEYNTSLLRKETIYRFLEHYKRLLEGVVEN